MTAVVPARNEADILPACLPTLLSQDYQGQFAVIVVDDDSADDTAKVATELGAAVISARPTPPGWAGKVWAMAEGAPRRRRGYRLHPVHRRRHRLCARHARQAGGCGSRRRVRAGVPDGAAAHRQPAGEAPRPGLRLLLRAAVPVPARQPAALADRGRSRRLHAGPRQRPGGGRRPGPDPRRADRRRRARQAAEAGGRALLARSHHRRTEPAALRPARRYLGHGRPQRLYPAALLARADCRGSARAGLAVPAAAGRGDRRGSSCSRRARQLALARPGSPPLAWRAGS